MWVHIISWAGGPRNGGDETGREANKGCDIKQISSVGRGGTLGSSAEHALALSHWRSNEAGAFTHHQFLSVVCGLLLGV